ncbi:hypothetical protein MHTCC0001_06420 [Flavobacteriaceae bacterium MHTCC 0001]
MNFMKEKSKLKMEYFSWLNKNQESHKSVISDAIDSIYNVNSNQFDTTDVENIQKGLELNHTICWALGEYVNKFAENDEVFVNLIKKLSKHSSSKVRLNIITNCLYNRPEKLTDNLLLKALNDKSKKVRLKVADVILRLNKGNLSKNLFKRAEIETDNETKNTLIWTYDLITKKWTYEAEWKCVRVHLKDGGVSGFYLKDGDDINDVDWIEKKVEEIRNEQ